MQNLCNTPTTVGGNSVQFVEGLESNSFGVSAKVYYRGHQCTFTYNNEGKRLLIFRIDSSGNKRTYLNLPIDVVINIESDEERYLRQQAHHMNDDSTKITFSEANDNMFFCATGDAPLYTPERSLYGNSKSTFHGRNSSSHSAAANYNSTALVSKDTRKKHFIHYIRLRHSQKPSLHSIEVISCEEAGALEQLNYFISSVLREIYQSGAKKLIIFVSPKSGKGKGESIVKHEILPILHFSRHSYKVHVTTRAHDCEDFVGDIKNNIDNGHVLVCAGGDGMIHEAVNGLHRRKLALLKQFRAEYAGKTAPFHHGSHPLDTRKDDECRDAPLDIMHYFTHCESVTEIWEKTLPMVATVATGSACGMAKSMGVLSTVQAALSLVHLASCPMDLMNMTFQPNSNMISYHRVKMCSAEDQRQMSKDFDAYLKKYGEELRERDVERRSAAENEKNGALDGSEICLVPGYLKDGMGEFKGPLSLKLHFPDLMQRIAFMSLSFGLANDIDYGSEPLRWLGNARFAVYGGYVIMKGVRKYPTVLRYLPWETKSGLKVEKIHKNRKMPSQKQIPFCTMKRDCPHCIEYPPHNPLAKKRRLETHDLNEPLIPKSLEPVGEGSPETELDCNGHYKPDGDVYSVDDEAKESGKHSPMEVNLVEIASVSDLSTEGRENINFNELSDVELLNEDVVDFDDETLPWVTIRGMFYNLLICNLKDVAQDMIMAPISHLSDGAIDLVYARVDPETGKGGRKEFVQFFAGLEKGTHTEYEFCHYVKARAVEITVDEGISMSDGELMPLSSARITKMRQGVTFVRSS